MNRQADERACVALAGRDRVLRRLVERNGVPSWRMREGGFPGLARIIIEQQLSVHSANAILTRVQALTNGLDAGVVLQAKQEELRAAGLSRPKIRYLANLADEVLSDRFSFAVLGALDDSAALEALQKLLGVGRWTAAVYLLFCEGRQDVWPRGDVALLAAHGAAGGDYGREQMKLFDAYAEEAFAPYRGVAAHLLWSEIARIKGREPL